MENKKIAKILIVIIVLATLGLLVFFFKKSLTNGNKNIVSQNTQLLSEENSIIAEPAVLETYPLNLENIKIYSLDKNGNKSEITNLVKLESSDENLIFVSNTDPIRGQVVAQKEGDYSIKASYQGKEIEIPVKVKKAELEIFCRVYPQTAKVGDKVTWTMMFRKMGTPLYTYSITGSDGLDSKNPVASIVYKTPGKKTVKMEVVDYTGAKAEVECEPYEVLPK